ncbi:hypothetical protein MBLNU457_2142t2 [Dothideomycetes sp. NU457]
MAAIQLNFSLRTSSKCKTVHLIGSWDGYAGQLPLSKDSSKSGGWKGTFKFQGGTLSQGARYWYYYVIDGYHVSHDPARESTVEPTTGRKLNILDIPHAKSSSTSKSHSSKASDHDNRRHNSQSVAKGRSLSPSQIKSPHPSKPYATKKITSEKFSSCEIEQLSRRYANQRIQDSSSEEEDSDSDASDGSLDVPSLRSGSSRSSGASSPSSVSSSSSCCTCERYAIKRDGTRVRLDCGGKRCGYSDEDESSNCSSEEVSWWSARFVHKTPTRNHARSYAQQRVSHDLSRDSRYPT